MRAQRSPRNPIPTPEPPRRPQPELEPQYLPLGDLSKVLGGISVSLIRQHIRQGILPATRFGARVLIAKTDVPAYVARVQRLSAEGAARRSEAARVRATARRQSRNA